MGLDGYRFGKNFGGKNAGSFKMKVKERYPKLKAKEVNELVEREFGDSPKGIEVDGAKEVKAEKPKTDGNSTGTKGKTAATEE